MMRDELYNEIKLKKWCDSLKVPRYYHQNHHLVKQHEREMEARELNEHGAYFSREEIKFITGKEQELRNFRETVLAIDVSKKLRKRAYTLMTFLIETISSVGGFVTVEVNRRPKRDNTTITWDCCKAELFLKEDMKRGWNLKSENSKSNMQPYYQKVPTGRLHLTIRVQEEVQEFEDTEEKPLEQQMDNIFFILFSLLISRNKKEEAKLEQERKLREEREEERKMERRKIEQAEQAKISQQKEHEEKNRQREAILAHMVKWGKIKQAEKYVSELRECFPKEPKLIDKYGELVNELFQPEQLYEEIHVFIKEIESKNKECKQKLPDE